MKKIKIEDFNNIKEDNSPEESDRQWKITKKIFDNFYEYMEGKKLNERTIGRYVEMSAFFIMDYVFVYEDIYSILDISEETIRKFLGNWYIRKNWTPNVKEIKRFLISIKYFFAYLNEYGYISAEALKGIKSVCKDKEWFEMRLKTYSEAEGDKFYDWLREYNYDVIF
jgi:site-specific recombinase XerD